MNSIAIHTDGSSAFSSGAVQQKFAPCLRTADVDVDCDLPDTAETFAARGIVYGLIVSVPLWGIIVGAIYLACRTMG